MVVNPSRDAKDERREDGKLFSPVVSCFASQKNDAGTSFDAGTPKRSRISLVSTGEHTSVRSLLCTAASSRATLGSPAAGTAASEARRTDSDSSAPFFFSARFTASCLACRSACKSCMSSMRAAFGRAARTLNENASSAVNRSKITASGLA